MRARSWIPAVVALLAYVLLWVAWAAGAPAVAAIDRALLDGAASLAAGRPGWVQGWDAFCRAGSPAVLRVLLIAPIIWLGVRRRWRAALFLLVAGEGSGLVDTLAKALAQRPRPAGALVPAWGSSFPSGHALGTLVIVLAVLAVVLPHVGPRSRALLSAVGLLFAMAIGVGRVMLLVHHPSDVLAGWLLGYAFFTLCRGILGPSSTAARVPSPTTTAPSPSGASSTSPRRVRASRGGATRHETGDVADEADRPEDSDRTHRRGTHGE